MTMKQTQTVQNGLLFCQQKWKDLPSLKPQGMLGFQETNTKFYKWNVQASIMCTSFAQKKEKKIMKIVLLLWFSQERMKQYFNLRFLNWGQEIIFEKLKRKRQDEQKKKSKNRNAECDLICNEWKSGREWDANEVRLCNTKLHFV